MISSLSKFFGGRHKADADEDWPSIVLLLREAQLPTANEAIEMAKAAWGAAGPVELLGAVGPHNFVIRVIPLTFALHAVGKRYDVSGLELPFVQQQAWKLHRAWLSVDLPGRRTAHLREEGRLGSAYQSLMHFVFRHWSHNLLAMYFPCERVIVPNQGDPIESIRSARRAGVNLDFLKVPKA
jgi:hypothetical protein